MHNETGHGLAEVLEVFLTSDSQVSRSEHQFHFGLFFVKPLPPRQCPGLGYAALHAPFWDYFILFYINPDFGCRTWSGLALARVSPWVSCSGEKCDCEMTVKSNLLTPPLTLLLLALGGWRQGKNQIFWELNIRKTNKTHSQNFFNGEHERTAEAASSSCDMVLTFFIFKPCLKRNICLRHHKANKPFLSPKPHSTASISQ